MIELSKTVRGTMKTILELKIESTGTHQSLQDRKSLAVQVNKDGYVKYSLWLGWNTDGKPECLSSLSIYQRGLDEDARHGRLPSSPLEGESTEEFGKRVMEVITNHSKFNIKEIVRPFKFND